MKKKLIIFHAFPWALAAVAVLSGCGSPGPQSSKKPAQAIDIIIAADPRAIAPTQVAQLQKTVGDWLLEGLPGKSSVQLTANGANLPTAIEVPIRTYDSKEGRARAYEGKLGPMTAYFAQTNTTALQTPTDVPALLRTLEGRTKSTNLTRVLIHASALYKAPKSDLVRFDMGGSGKIFLPNPMSFDWSPADSPFGLQSHTNLHADVYFVVSDADKFSTSELEKLKSCWGEYVKKLGGTLCQFDGNLLAALQRLGLDEKGKPLTLARLDYGKPTSDPLAMVAINDVTTKTPGSTAPAPGSLASANPKTPASLTEPDKTQKQKSGIAIGPGTKSTLASTKVAPTTKPEPAKTPTVKTENITPKPTQPPVRVIQQQAARSTDEGGFVPRTPAPMKPSDEKPVWLLGLSPDVLKPDAKPGLTNRLALAASVAPTTTNVAAEAVLDLSGLKGVKHGVAIRWPNPSSREKLDLDLVLRNRGTVISYKTKQSWFARNLGWLTGTPKVTKLVDVQEGGSQWEIIELDCPLEASASAWINLFRGRLDANLTVDFALIENGKITPSKCLVRPSHGNEAHGMPTRTTEPRGNAWHVVELPATSSRN